MLRAATAADVHWDDIWFKFGFNNNSTTMGQGTRVIHKWPHTVLMMMINGIQRQGISGNNVGVLLLLVAVMVVEYHLLLLLLILYDVIVLRLWMMEEGRR